MKTENFSVDSVTDSGASVTHPLPAKPRQIRLVTGNGSNGNARVYVCAHAHAREAAYHATSKNHETTFNKDCRYCRYCRYQPVSMRVTANVTEKNCRYCRNQAGLTVGGDCEG